MKSVQPLSAISGSTPKRTLSSIATLMDFSAFLFRQAWICESLRASPSL